MARSVAGTFPPTAAVRFAGWLRALADRLDPFGSGDLDKMRAAGDRAMARMDRRRRDLDVPGPERTST